MIQIPREAATTYVPECIPNPQHRSEPRLKESAMRLPILTSLISVLKQLRITKSWGRSRFEIHLRLVMQQQLLPPQGADQAAFEELWLDGPDVHGLLEETVVVLPFLLAWYIAASAFLIRASAS
jgi:hypothetical protein